MTIMDIQTEPVPEPMALPCPVAVACGVCGATVASGADLAACEAETPVGVVCLTMCWPCEEAGNIPKMSIGAAMGAVMAHCGHTGRDLDGNPAGTEGLS